MSAPESVWSETHLEFRRDFIYSVHLLDGYEQDTNALCLSPSKIMQRNQNESGSLTDPRWNSCKCKLYSQWTITKLSLRRQLTSTKVLMALLAACLFYIKKAWNSWSRVDICAHSQLKSPTSTETERVSEVEFEMFCVQKWEVLRAEYNSSNDVKQAS